MVCSVQDPETGILINADYRISESAWLKPTGNGEDNDKIIQKYRKRISMITGLTMERAEDVQLGNDLKKTPNIPVKLSYKIPV